MKLLRFAIIVCVTAVLLSLTVTSQTYSGTAAFWQLGMGARPIALGGAFVCPADDENALLHNPAGLAWGRGLSLASSAEIRSSAAGYGHVSACLGNFGAGLHYLDLGNVPQTDELANVIGSFSYRSYGLVVGTGFRVSDIALLADLPLSDSIAAGLCGKFLAIDTLDQGDGNGLGIDAALLLRFDSPWFAQRFLSTLEFGFVARNVLSSPMQFASGHFEDWVREVDIGLAVQIVRNLLLSMQANSGGSRRLGLEWSPVPGLDLRAGLRQDGVRMWSFGVGTHLGYMQFDYALVLHPYLRTQHRGSFTLNW